MFGEKPPVTMSPTPPRARGEVGGELAEVARVVFQARVHRTHQHPVRKCREAEIERGEQVRIGRGGRVGHGVERAFENTHDAGFSLRRQAVIEKRRLNAVTVRVNKPCIAAF